MFSGLLMSLELVTFERERERVGGGGERQTDRETDRETERQREI